MVTINRAAAIGDIILVTPIVEALRKKYGRACLRVHPSLHNRMHALLNCAALEIVNADQGDVIDLNNAYELRPHLHPVEAYAEVAGVSLADTTPPFSNVRHSVTRGRFDVVIHATVSWPNRTLPRAFWAGLVAMLKAEGLTVACVAQNTAEIVEGCDKNFVNLPLPEVAGLIDGAGVFIGGDSAPLHVASTTCTPVVGLFTIAKAALRHPWRHESKTFVGIDAAVDCVGCLHRAPVPCSFWDCDHKDARRHACLSGFSIPEIASKVLEVL